MLVGIQLHRQLLRRLCVQQRRGVMRVQLKLH
jgi:hypothetical protein